MSKRVNPCPWWHFWDPMSGLPGGLLAGALFWGVVVVIRRLTLGHV